MFLLQRTTTLENDEIDPPEWDVIVHFDKPVVRLTLDERRLDDHCHSASLQCLDHIDDRGRLECHNPGWRFVRDG